MHVCLNFDFQDSNRSWVRSFNYGNTQFHTKACIYYGAMNTRCQTPYKQKFTTYAEVSTEFKDFNHFAEWCQTQKGYTGCDDKKNWCLDKDILIIGNKTYSPDTCVFVPEFINVLFSNKKITGLPFGVTKHLNRYRARCSTLQGRIHLGCFTTPMEAHYAWQRAKAEHIYNIAHIYLKLPESDLRVFNALILRHNLIKSDANNGVETLVA